MSLIQLYNPLRTEEDLLRFADYNFSDHLVVIDALHSKKNIDIALLDIRLLLFDFLSTWAFNHQSMHNQTNSFLGLPGSDFTHIDLSDQSQLDSMRQLHAEEHRQWHDILGI